MLTTHEIRPLYDGNERLDCYYSYPDKPQGRLPAILIFSPWSGRNHFAEQKANLLAQMGYIGIAVDLYGNGKTGETKEECSALIRPFMEDRQFLKNRITNIINHLKQDPTIDAQKIVAMGYCFGGLCALDTVRNNLGVCAGISIHGLYSKPNYDLPSLYRAKLLTLHGQKDPMVPTKEVQAFQQELQNAQVDWQMIIYGLGYHAFTNPEVTNDPHFGTVFNASLHTRTTVYMTAFLKEILG